MSLPQMMTTVVMDGNGEPDVLHVSQRPVPQADAGEILVQVAAAGVGVWDAGERSGAMAAMLPDDAKHFPRVIGGDGSGTVILEPAGLGSKVEIESNIKRLGGGAPGADVAAAATRGGQ